MACPRVLSLRKSSAWFAHCLVCRRCNGATDESELCETGVRILLP